MRELLQADTGAVAEMRRAAQHARLLTVLPELLMEATAAAHEATGPDRERRFGLLTVLLFAAHSVTYKIGYADLSAVVEDRTTWAAERSSDPLMGALAAWARTNSMLQAGSYDIGQRLLDRVRDEIDPGRCGDDREALRVAGPLHLRSAILAARAGDADTTRSHLAEADRLATYLGGGDDDGGRHQLSFGPTNVDRSLASHIRTVLSRPAEMMTSRSSSRPRAITNTQSAWPVSGSPICRPSASHNRTVPS
nr:hypothetical protein [Fodinicola acaciae]